MQQFTYSSLDFVIVYRIHRDMVDEMDFCVKYIRSPGPFISMCKQVILSFTAFIINQNVDYILEIIFFLEKDKHRVCACRSI